MHNGMCGHTGPASCDQTLADYIHRKSRTDAFNQVNAEKKKLTFEDWWYTGTNSVNNPYPHGTPKFWAYEGWIKAQENK